MTVTKLDPHNLGLLTTNNLWSLGSRELTHRAQKGHVELAEVPGQNSFFKKKQSQKFRISRLLGDLEFGETTKLHGFRKI